MYDMSMIKSEEQIKDIIRELEEYYNSLPIENLHKESNEYQTIYNISNELYKSARKNDRLYRISQILYEIKNIFTDTQLVYLQYKYKTVDRIAEKLYHKTKGQIPTQSEANELIQDTLRYTFIIKDNTYVERIDQILSILERKDFKIVEYENKWDCPTYKGIKAIFEKDGFRFEVQFQTLYSFIIKEDKTRIPYKVIRNPFASEEMKDKANFVRVFYQNFNEPPEGAIGHIYESQVKCKVKMK